MSVNHINWIKLHIALTLRSAAFYMSLLLLFAVTSLFSLAMRAAADDVRVILYSEDTVSGRRIEERLLNMELPGFTFVRAESRSDVEALVKSGEYSCGAVFSESLDEAVRDGVFRRDIIFYQCAESIHGYTVKDVIFPVILSECGANNLKSYIEAHDKSLPDETVDDIMSEFEALMDSEDLSIFNDVVVESAGERQGVGVVDEKKSALFIWILFTAVLFAAGEILTGMEGYLALFRGSGRFLPVLEAVGTYGILLGALGGLICFASKLPVVLLYSILCSAWAAAFATVIRNSRVYYPLALIAAVLSFPLLKLAPETAVYFGWLRWVTFLFPTGWG